MIPQHIQELMTAAVSPSGATSKPPSEPAATTNTRATYINATLTNSVYSCTQPQPQRCKQCNRPRDNNHPMLCPICHLNHSEKQVSKIGKYQRATGNTTEPFNYMNRGS